jgi:hypothetical protein
LNINGVLVGRVQKVIGPEVLPETGIEAYISNKSESVSKYTNEVRAFAKSLATPAEQDTFWRTLILGHDFRSLKPSYPAPAEFGTMASVVFFGRPLPQDFMAGCQLDLRLAMFAAPFLKSWERTRWNRCFFTTEEGHMGVGPFCVQPGDIAVILFGGEFPFILRQFGSRYKLIGDAYIHGTMHGELVDGKDPKHSQTFGLC